MEAINYAETFVGNPFLSDKLKKMLVLHSRDFLPNTEIVAKRIEDGGLLWLFKQEDDFSKQIERIQNRGLRLNLADWLKHGCIEKKERLLQLQQSLAVKNRISRANLSQVLKRSSGDEESKEYFQSIDFFQRYQESLEYSYFGQKAPVLKPVWNSYASFSGRITCMNPAIISFPKEIRGYFLPNIEGNQLYSIDFKAAELQIMAAYAGEDDLLHRLWQGEDIYIQFGELLQSIESPNVKMDVRKMGKIALISNFYGITPFGLAKKFGITILNAERFVSLLQHALPKITQLIVELKSFSGYFLQGQKIELSNMLTPYQKVNLLPQSTVAGLLKNLVVDTGIADATVALIHDEIIFEATDKNYPMIYQAMQQSLRSSFKKMGLTNLKVEHFI